MPSKIGMKLVLKELLRGKERKRIIWTKGDCSRKLDCISSDLYSKMAHKQKGLIAFQGTTNVVGDEEWCLLGCYAVWLL
jgi:hypothetical protein